MIHIFKGLSRIILIDHYGHSWIYDNRTSGRDPLSYSYIRHNNQMYQTSKDIQFLVNLESDYQENALPIGLNLTAWS